MTSSQRHSAPNWNALWAGLVIEELVRCGVDTFCIAPGSRSTPLVVAAARHPRARTVVHIDERGAAFFALGRARATGRATAWITTSGTAAANGLPAVIEASQDQVPLLCLTADRPPELRDTGANQAIHQPGLFGRYPRWHFDLPAPSAAVSPAFVLTTMDQAVFRTRGVDPGPVHINLMFREPLAPDGAGVALDKDLIPWWEGHDPYTQYAPLRVDDDVAPLRASLTGKERGIVVAGRGGGAAAARLAEALRWPLLADVGSGQRLGPVADCGITHYDLLLGAGSWSKGHLPDAVIQVGAAPVSKRLLKWLTLARPAVYAVLAPSPARLDPAHRVTHRLTGDPVAACAALGSLPPGDGDWLAQWQRANAQAAEAIRPLLQRTLSEPAVAARVAALIPTAHGLFLSNSMPIRDMDTFAGGGETPAAVGVNRGASGIDGVVSSAAGFADGLAAPLTLVIGDLALLHDLNGLALLQDRRLVVVVINNDGGGIFSFLPIAAHVDVFEPLFGTPHGRRFESAAALFDLAYEAPADVEAFDSAYVRALEGPGPTLIEVRTDRTQNVANHRALSAAVAAALGT